jgi:Zn finger protein HypA/HybF involved in hydrogenase expression
MEDKSTAIFKCKKCDGDIIATDGAVFGECDLCGTTSTLPKVTNGRIVNLFN